MNRFEATWLGAMRAGGDGVARRQGAGGLLRRRRLGGAAGLPLGGAQAAWAWSWWWPTPTTGCARRRARRPNWCAGLCRSADLDLVEAGLDVRAHAQAAGLGLETAARELRWTWLRALAAAEGAAAVATGHTLDDHTETVLVRLARGGGAGCLTPLPAAPGPALVAPGPGPAGRAEGLPARQSGMPWLEDASNQEPFTPRNRWRRLLEPMRAEAPALDAHLWETHLQVAELAAFRDRRWKPGAGPAGRPAGRRPACSWPAPGPSPSCAGPWRRPAGTPAGPGSRTCCGTSRPGCCPTWDGHAGRPSTWGGWRLERQLARPGRAISAQRRFVVLGAAQIGRGPPGRTLRPKTGYPARHGNGGGDIPPGGTLNSMMKSALVWIGIIVLVLLALKQIPQNYQSQRDRLLDVLHRGRRGQVPQRHPHRAGRGGHLQDPPSRAPRAR